MNLYLDTEFNGFGGELISMALVSEKGQEWYANLGCKNPVEWVRDNVVPVLDAPEMTKEFAQASLQRFLGQFDEINIVADWPEDISHFCTFLITGPGKRLPTIPMKMEFRPITSFSKKPHNALADARAIREAMRS